MSSILDALNKLEEDKALAQSTPEGLDLDPDSAAEELVGPSMLRDRITLRFTPLTLIVAGLIATVVIVSFSVAASLLVVRSSGLIEDAAVRSDPEVTSTALVIETPNTEIDESAEIAGAGMRPTPTETRGASSAAAGSEDVAPSSPQAPEQPSSPAAMPAEIQEVPEAASPLAAPEATRPDPAPAPARLIATRTDTSAGQGLQPDPAAPNELERPRQAQVLEAATGDAPFRTESAPDLERLVVIPSAGAETRLPSRSEEVVPIDDSPVPSLVELPRLTYADRARYTDVPWRINMLNPQSDINPYGFAVINVVKVYEGQNISGTQFKLIGVDMDGIGVAVRGTTKRFYIPF